MKELLSTNNLVTISFVEVLLRDSSLDYVILDQNMSLLEGSIGIIPRRVMVADDDWTEARQLMIDAGLERELPA